MHLPIHVHHVPRITSAPSTICLICKDPHLENQVRLTAAEADLLVFPMEGLLTAENVLSGEGLRVVEAASRSDATLIEWDFERAPELNTVCFHIRRTATVPVFMLVGGREDDHVAAIAAGADDALEYAFDPALLSAKILSYRRLVRAAVDAERAALVGSETESAKTSHDVVRFGPLALDRRSHRFYIRDQEVELTPREYGLIDYLITHGNELCTRDNILDGVWGITFDTGTNMVDVYMYFLRRKLEGHGLSSMIETIRGRGYRLTFRAD